MTQTQGGSAESRRPQQRAGRQPRAQQGGEFQSSDQVLTALIEGATFRGKAVQYSVVDGLAIFEGDIVLGTEEQVLQRTQQLRDEMTGAVAAGVVISGAQFRWPNCTVPYTIDPALPTQSRVTDAIAHWQANTRFRFVLRTTETDYTTFRPSSGCSSAVGKRGNQQFVNLGSGCTTGNTIHEIGHVIGMWHEQSREDRDAFVTIHWDKIQPGYEHNFNQHITDGDDVGAYDYGSIMHYPRTAFSVDGSDTITPTNATTQIGQRTALSAGDIATANSLCPPVIKRARKDSLKDIRKDIRWDTQKELVKDIRLDTRKEIILDTQKEAIKDRIKEVALDPPWRKGLSDRIGPGVTPVRPVQPGIRPGGMLPFAVVTPHQAAAAGGGDQPQLEAVVADLDTQLQSLAEQLAETEATREMLQAQYDETTALLQDAMDAHDQASPP